MLRSLIRRSQCKSSFNNSLFITSNDNKKAFLILRKYGILVVKEAFNPFDLLSEITTAKKEKLLKSKLIKSTNYRRLKGSYIRGKHRTFIKARSRYESIDKGIIDVHNINSEDFIGKISSLITAKCIEIVRDAFPSENLSNNYYFNYYHYENVRTPRAFHRDTTKLRIKCFIPLSPCSKMDEGPYAAYPESFKRIFLNYAEILFNKLFGSDLGEGLLDATLTSKDKLIPIFYQPGDLIIYMEISHAKVNLKDLH